MTGSNLPEQMLAAEDVSSAPIEEGNDRDIGYIEGWPLLLTTVAGFLIIWAKLSDIFGPKLLIVTSLGHFVIISGACGAAKTMNRLYVHAQIRRLPDRSMHFDQ
ncbi:MAG: hypothetical protein L6R36_008310 [Xanthoria steineri]|nr:MAG: hypothetical protein L6R36_008310 [Xanthoria steineri]